MLETMSLDPTPRLHPESIFKRAGSAETGQQAGKAAAGRTSTAQKQKQRTSPAAQGTHTTDRARTTRQTQEEEGEAVVKWRSG